MTNTMRSRADLIAALTGGLVVSCQAPVGSPLREPYITAKLAQAALMGGAAGVRINGPEDIAAVRAITDVPIIGLFKVQGDRRSIITPDLNAAASLIAVGADIVALDSSEEVRGTDLSLIAQVREEFGVAVMADVSTLAEGVRAWEAGADIVGTTLSGYTPQTQPATPGPDLALVAALSHLGIRVVAEGRYRSPDQVAQAVDAGAMAVVVGAAITDPLATTAIFTRATPRGGR
jgi:N-acylglucosamine-6-phosphate 2-epimerase